MWYYGGRIRIEPDWNVKKDCHQVATDVEFYQNRTRLECKVDYCSWNIKQLTYQNRTRLECKEVYKLRYKR